MTGHARTFDGTRPAGLNAPIATMLTASPRQRRKSFTANDTLPPAVQERHRTPIRHLLGTPRRAPVAPDFVLAGTRQKSQNRVGAAGGRHAGTDPKSKVRKSAVRTVTRSSPEGLGLPTALYSSALSYR